MKTKRFISILMTAVMMLSVVFCAVPTVGAETTKVTGLKQTSASRTSISFSWTTQLGVDYYEVQMKESNSNNWVMMTKYASGNDIEYNLNTATNYDVRVRARNSSYNGKWSDVVTMGTACDKVTNLRQTYAQTNSITFSWSKVNKAEKYQLYFYDNDTETVKGITSNTSYTVKNLKSSNFPKYVYVKPIRYVNGQSIVENDDYYNYENLYGFQLRLRPGKGPKPTVSNYYGYLKQEDIKIYANSNADGYECKIYNAKGKNVGTYSTTSYSDYSYFYLKNISSNQYYKIRVRGYVNVNGKKLYGTWSNPIYTHLKTNLKLKFVGSKKINVSWNKVAGATSYSVYSSDKNGGYKKVCTTKKNSVSITKIKNKKLKSGKTYYFYVIANKKVGKTTYKSGLKEAYYIRRIG